MLRTSFISRTWSRLFLLEAPTIIRACSSITKYEPQEISTEEHWTKKINRQEPMPILSSKEPSPSYVQKYDETNVIKMIYESQEIDEVLRVTRHHVNEFEEEHLVHCFRKINKLTKQKRKIDCEELHHNSDFINLCSRLRKRVPTFTTSNSLITCLKTLVFLNVQSDSKIVSNLLYNLKSRINNLSLQEVLFLDFLLANMEGPLVEALKLALPIVSESQLNSQLPSADLTTTVKLLQFYSKKGAPLENQKKLVQHLMTFSNEEWSGLTCQTILRALMNWTLVKEVGAVPLLNKAMEDLATHVNECRPGDFGWLLGRCVTLYAVKRPYWFNERLCRAVADRVLKENWSAEDTYSIVLALAKFKMFHPELVEYFSRKLLSSELLGLKKKGDFTFYIMKAFSQSTYLPKNFEDIKEKLFSADNLYKVDKYDKPDRWIRLALHCATLGVYEHKIISEVFEKSMLEQELSHLDILALNTLDRAVRIENPQYPGPFPDASFMEKSLKSFKFSNSPIKKAIELAVGGSNYVIHDTFTRWGHYIEHAVVVGADGSFLDIDQQNVQFVDNLSLPEDYKVILLKVFQPFDYFINTDRLLGVPSMEMRTLERAGYNAIEISSRIWNRLTEQERIPFLRQQIRLAISTMK